MKKNKISKPAEPAKAKKDGPVKKNMLMGEIVSKHPQVTEILMKHGFHCVGCMISPYESLEAGSAVHGIPLAPLLKEINKSIN